MVRETNTVIFNSRKLFRHSLFS